VYGRAPERYNRAMSRPLAAITGASAGIGAVFARKLAAHGYDLLLIARRRERLEKISAELPVEAEPFPADLAAPEDLERVAARLAAEPRLALLVNNAGFGIRGRFFEAQFEDQERMHRVHIDAILRLTHAALGPMVRRNEGGIVNVSSVAAFARSPANVSYCATKTWINAFTEGLYLELRGIGSKVKVQALCPGFTYTEFHDVLGMDRSVIPRWLWMSAEDVVDASLAGLDAGKLFVIPGWKYRLFVSCFSRLPAGLRIRLEARSPHTRNRL
jgi:short-subunit dehydrogenase